LSATLPFSPFSTLVFRKLRAWFVSNLALVILGALGTLLILVATRWGVGLRDDSFYYIQPAREILAGRPFFFHPHFPPFLPLVVTAVSLFGSEPLASLRYLNAALFGVNIVLSGVIVRRLTSAPAFGALAALLVLVSPVTAEAHAWGMSEPLYFTLALLNFYWLGRYFELPGLRWLLLAGAMAGLAFWTRYVGVALLGAGLLALLLHPRLPLARRLRDCLAYGTIGSIPIFLYALRNLTVIGQPVNYRGFEWQPMVGKELAETLYTFLLWFMPGRLARGREELAAYALIGGLLALLAAFFFLNRPVFRSVWHTARSSPLLSLLLWFMATTFGVLYAAHYAVAYKSPFDSRLTSPIHLGMLLALAGLSAWLWRSGGRWLKFAVAAAACLLVLLYLPRTLDMTRYFYQHGAGFAARYWHESETIAYIRQRPDLPIISTAPFGIYFWANRLTAVVSAYDTGIALQSFLRESGAVLIVFHTMPLDMYGIDEKEYLRGLQKLIEMDDSTIYTLK